MKHSIRKYIEVDEVFNRVSASLKSYFDSDMIVIEDYYKVIELCNSNLGIRLNPTKEALIDINNFSAELPSDFLMLDLALVVNTVKNSYMYGVRKTETLTGVCPTAEELSIIDNPCCGFKLHCGKKPVLVCEYENISIEFEETHIARLTEKKHISDDCFNLNSDSPYMMEINNGQIFTDAIEKGKLYILYTARMSAEGNIPICLDNPIVMEYYEQALRYKILEDLYINKRLDISQALSLVQREYIMAKNAAISLVTTPEFDEIISINNALKRQYRKFNSRLVYGKRTYHNKPRGRLL